SLRPLAWALCPATDWPSVSASSSSKPRRWATTAAHKVRTGARLIEMVFMVFMASPPDGPQIPLRRPRDRRLAVPVDHRIPERSVHPVIGERLDRPDDSLDGRGR